MTQSKYYREIDSLRALAVIAVIINHLNKEWLPGGFLGVDIFFVISGFVVIASLQNKSANSFKDFLKEFYSRRFKRLWPLLVTVVLIFFIPTFAFLYKPDVYIKTGFYSLLGFSNIYLFNNAFDYFSTSTETNPFTHTWSLGVEEQFYFVLPLMYYFGQRKNNFKVLLSIVTVASFFAFLYFKEVNSLASFYMMPTRFWQFSLGIFAYLIIVPNIFQKISKHFVLLFLLGLFAVILFTPEFNTISTVLISLFVFCTLWFIKSTQERAYLTYGPVLKIGLVSYSLYLLHWPVIVFMRELKSIEGRDLLFTVFFILIFSFIFNRYIENKFRSLRWGWKHCLFFFSFFCIAFLIKDFRKEISNRLNISMDVTNFSLYHKKEYLDIMERCHLQQGSEIIDHTGVEISNRFKNCFFRKEGTHVIYSFGNSHSLQYLSSILKFSELHDFKMTHVSRAGAKIYPFNSLTEEKEKFYPRKMTKLFFEYAASETKKGDVIIISTPLSNYLNDNNFMNDKNQKIIGREALDVFISFLQDNIRLLNQKGVTLFYINGFPLLRKDLEIKNCISQKFFKTKRCTYPNIIDEESTKKLKELDIIVKEALGDNYISSFDPIEKMMQSLDKPYLLYFDRVHLSFFGDESLNNFIEKSLSLKLKKKNE